MGFFSKLSNLTDKIGNFSSNVGNAVSREMSNQPATTTTAQISQNGELGWPQSYTITNFKGEKYIYVPEEFANKGLLTQGYQFYNPGFLQKGAFDKASSITLPPNLAISSDVYQNPNKGFIWKSEDYEKINPKGFDNIGYYVSDKHPAIEGLSSFNGNTVYKVPTESGYQATYINGLNDQGNTNFRSTRMEGGGGLFGGVLGDIASGVGNLLQDIGPVGQLAAAYYGGSALADALGIGAGAGLSALDAGMNVYPATELAAAVPAFTEALPQGYSAALPAAGAGVQVASTLPGAGLESLPAGVEGMGGAQGLQLPQSANLAEMGGGQGLGGGTSLANLADMGGAQGLTTAAAGLGAGSLLGATGTGGALTPAAAGLGAGLGLSEAATGAGSALAGTAAGAGLGGAAGAAGGAVAGNALSDILPYTTAAGLLGGYLQSTAAKDAAQIQADAANKALAQQQANFELINAQQAPYRAAGYNTLNEIAKLSAGQTPQYDYLGNIVKDAAGNPVMTTGSGYLTHQFTPEDFAAGIDPGYAFRLQQGQMANQRAANVGGGALSGNTLRGLQDYTQGLASQEYGNAFNRYQTQRQNIYNTLASIAGIGQTGQTATNTAATNATNAATQLGIGSAAAQAAGGVGSANAYTNAINNAANNYTLASLLNQRGNVVMPVQG